MKPMTLDPKEAGGRALYLQIYDNLINEILSGEAAAALNFITYITSFITISYYLVRIRWINNS